MPFISYGAGADLPKCVSFKTDYRYVVCNCFFHSSAGKGQRHKADNSVGQFNNRDLEEVWYYEY